MLTQFWLLSTPISPSKPAHRHTNLLPWLSIRQQQNDCWILSSGSNSAFGHIWAAPLNAMWCPGEIGHKLNLAGLWTVTGTSQVEITTFHFTPDPSRSMTFSSVSVIPNTSTVWVTFPEAKSLTIHISVTFLPHSWLILPRKFTFLWAHSPYRLIGINKGGWMRPFRSRISYQKKWCFKEAVLFDKMMISLCYALKPKRLRSSLITVAAIMTANMNPFFFLSDRSKVQSQHSWANTSFPFRSIIYQPFREESKFKLQGHRGSGRLRVCLMRARGRTVADLILGKHFSLLCLPLPHLIFPRKWTFFSSLDHIGNWFPHLLWKNWPAYSSSAAS